MPRPVPLRRRTPALVLALLLAGACGEGAPSGLEPAGPEAQALAEGVADALVSGDSHGAFARAEAALELFPGARELHVELAHAAAATNRPGLAIETWNALLPGAAPDERLRLQRRIAHEALTHGLVAEAAAAVADLAALPAPEAFDHLLLSLDAFERGALDAALAHARRGQELDPRDATLAYQVARCELTLELPAARASLERTLELDPGQDRAYFNLAQLAIERGDEAAADELFARQNTIRELTRKAFTSLPPKQRLQLAGKIARELPEWSLPAIEIAQAQLELGQPRRTQETLEEARQKRPFNLRTIELSYAAARARNQENEARQWLRRWRQASGLEAPTE